MFTTSSICLRAGSTYASEGEEGSAARSLELDISGLEDEETALEAAIAILGSASTKRFVDRDTDALDSFGAHMLELLSESEGIFRF